MSPAVAHATHGSLEIASSANSMRIAKSMRVNYHHERNNAQEMTIR